MDCVHTEKQKEKVKKTVVGLDFEYTTDVCQDCGAALWTNEIDIRFNDWLVGLGQEHKDKFKVQKIPIPKDINDEALTITKKFGKDDVSFFYRACLSVYLNKVLGDEEMEEHVERAVAAAGPSSEIVMKPLRLAPKLYIDLKDFADVAGVSMQTATAEIIKRVVYGMRGKTKVRDEVDVVLHAA